MPDFDQANERVVNEETIEEDVRLRAQGIEFVNTELGRVLGLFVFEVGGSTLINEFGGFIGPPDQTFPISLLAIQGSDGDDTVINFGVIDGRMELNGGNDNVTINYPELGPGEQPTQTEVDLGSGDDVLRLEGEGGSGSSFFYELEGGEGYDTLELVSSIGPLGSVTTGFEALVLNEGQFYTGFDGFLDITAFAGPARFFSLLESDNPDALLRLGGHFWRLRDGSVVESVVGTDADEGFVIADTSSVLTSIELGGGNDEFGLFNASFDFSSLEILDGGEGDADIFDIQLTDDFILDFGNIVGFEDLFIFNREDITGINSIDVALSGLSGFRTLDATANVNLTLTNSDLTDTALSGALGGSINIAAGMTVASYSWLIGLTEPSSNNVTPDLGNSVDIINAGTITGSVFFLDGDDLYDGTAGSAAEVHGSAGNDRLLGGDGSDVFFGDAGADRLNGNGGADSLTGGLGTDALDGGSNVDTAVVSGNRADYTVTQTSLGVFEVVGPDGTDTLTNVEFLQFDDQTMRLLRGTGVAVNFETADPSVYQDAMNAILDFDGNALGGNGNWLRIGSADVNGDGDIDQILVNDAIGRFATVGTADDGLVYFNDNSWAGETRVAGIYLDPLVISGEVVQGSDQDSQRRFQNDLEIENINRVLGADDYDGDGLQEVYFALTDGTAYLRAIMEADGNIRYANYQSEQEVIDYLTANGFDENTFGDWFTPPTGQAEDGTTTFVNEVQSDKQANEEGGGEATSPTDLVAAMLEAKALAGVDLEHAPFAPLTQEGLSPAIDPLGVEFFG